MGPAPPPLAAAVAAKHAALAALRPLKGRELAQLRRYLDVELTFTSNAIEGNTLTAVETELVIDKGVTIAGKPLRDHLEALDHHDALGFVHELGAGREPLTAFTVRSLHGLVMRRSQPEIAGRYADLPRYVRTEGGRRDFPPPAAVPAAMDALGRWLETAAPTPEAAFAAHWRLVDVHPFNDGNGRTARLLMNLLLIRGGYPPVAVRPQDRQRYLAALGDMGEGRDAAYVALMWERLDQTLDEVLAALT